MRMMPVIILFCFLLGACQNDTHLHRVLDEADRVVMTDPDSAVVMLGQLDLSKAAASQRAHHALLLTKARHKAHIVETDDSLIRIASDYYRGSGDSLETQSLFYNGVILRYAKQYPEALLYLMEAADRATENADDFYRGMACREQASIYNELYNFERAAELGCKAAKSFNRADRPLHAAWERVYIPQYLVYSGDADSAYDSIQVLAKDSLIQSDEALRKEFLWIASNVCFEREDYEQSERYFDILVEEGAIPSSKMYSQMAELKLSKGDVIAAKRLLEYAKEQQEDVSDSLAAQSVLAEIYAAEGNYKDAYMLNTSLQDSITERVNKLITHPYTTLLNNYFHTETNHKALLLAESERRTHLLIVVSLVLLIITSLLIYIYRHRLLQKDLEREILIRDISCLEAKMSEVYAVSITESYSKQTDNQFILSVLKSICDYQSTLYSKDKKNDNFSVKVSNLLYSLTNDKNIAALEVYINDNLDNLMLRFRKQAPMLNDRQFRLAVFVFLGFSNTTIASLFQYSNESAVRQMRYRIRKKLKNNPTTDTAIFMRYF